MSNKDLYSRQELAQAFGYSHQTITKMLAKKPSSAKRKTIELWKLRDVSTLNDCRKPKLELYPMTDIIELNPDKMKAAERRLHYQAEDLKQSANIKLRRNETESRVLIPAAEVEAALSTGFKAVALTLDTLPDTLERDGVIASSDVDAVIRIVDKLRDELANKLNGLRR